MKNATVINGAFAAISDAENTNIIYIIACTNCINIAPINSLSHILYADFLSIEYVIVIIGEITTKKPIFINLIKYLKKNFTW